MDLEKSEHYLRVKSHHFAICSAVQAETTEMREERERKKATFPRSAEGNEEQQIITGITSELTHIRALSQVSNSLIVHGEDQLAQNRDSYHRFPYENGESFWDTRVFSEKKNDSNGESRRG